MEPVINKDWGKVQEGPCPSHPHHCFLVRRSQKEGGGLACHDRRFTTDPKALFAIGKFDALERTHKN